jgi:hypothetical protein
MLHDINYWPGLGDCVKCFSCGGGLRNWEFYDVPWEQHAKWFNHCAFLREQKGLEFIRHHSDVRIDADEERQTIPVIVKFYTNLQIVNANPLTYRITYTKF